ncbi:hypothetical protein BLOT_002859 [Blomia tropicalis]|nr:hypothetical protein BLOT_002859 [Blomia tropicalis]
MNTIIDDEINQMKQKILMNYVPRSMESAGADRTCREIAINMMTTTTTKLVGCNVCVREHQVTCT